MLVAADGSDVVYRRARLEEMVYKVRGQMQYLNKVGCSQWTVGRRRW